MEERKGRKPYEKPAVTLERDLEALAADCGTGINNAYLGNNNCKGLDTQCEVLFS
jgi:hypothetical protein